MATRKVVWISGSLTLLGLIAVLVSIPGVTVTTSGDITCSTECVSYFNLTSKTYNLCFNVTQLIETFPNTKTELYIWNSSKRKWQPFNLTNTCLKGTTKRQFKVVGHKQPLQSVKWWSKSLNIPDPVWKGVDLELVYPCLKNQTESQAYNCQTQDYNATEYTYTYEWTYNPNNDTYYNKTIEHPYNVIKQRDVCSYKDVIVGCSSYDSQHLKYGDLLIDTKKELGVYCGYVNKSIIQCDDCNFDGNCDGILSDGESGIERITPETIYYLGYRKSDLRIKFSNNNIKEGIEK
jgi:hypothetical protein